MENNNQNISSLIEDNNLNDENKLNENNSINNENKLVFSDKLKSLFRSYIKWLKLFAIFFYIISSIIILHGILRNCYFHYNSIIFAIMFIIYGTPIFAMAYLFWTAATKIKKGLKKEDQKIFEKGIERFKTSIKLTAVISIIYISFIVYWILLSDVFLSSIAV
ncbi:MAG: DUF5362 family protein [Bacteroidales bacterium]|jgi:hypothetical protein|nr:DUF5362 family protein [Bacteroidales bacterium]